MAIRRERRATKRPLTDGAPMRAVKHGDHSLRLVTLGVSRGVMHGAHQLPTKAKAI